MTAGGERLAKHLRDGFGKAVRRHRAKTPALMDDQVTDSSAAKTVRLLQDRLEHRSRVAGRAVDDIQHLGQRRLPRQRRIAFGALFVELLPQRGIGALKFGYLVVEW